MWINMRAYQTVINNSCPHINAELLLVSRMDTNFRIFLRLLVLVVNTDDIATTPISLNGNSNPW
jgi:hypothetical protein